MSLPTARELREKVAHGLAAMPDRQARVAAVRRLLIETGHPDAPHDTRSHVGWRMRLLGRPATSTASADGAIANWIAATLREFGHGEA